VFILADDLGWTDLGSFGTRFYETPNLDRLAARGTRFTNAYAACPVCSPTRASIMAGKYPARMDTTEWFGGRRAGKMLPAEYVDHLPLEEVTIAEALREAGYRTFFAGKWHLGGEGFDPELQGFEYNAGGFSRGSPPGGYFSPYKNPKLADGPQGEHLPLRLADEAAAFLDRHGEEPFLLYLSFYSVHTPLQSTEALKRKYREKRERLPEDREVWGQEGERKLRLVQDHAVYAGMVEAMDASVGRVLDKLEQLGLDEETIVIFTSDNGGLSTSEGHPTSNLPLRAGKGWLYEGGIREPTLVRWPGVADGGEVCDETIISTDFYPTMLEMAGLDPRAQQHRDGLSFAELLRGGAAPERDAVFWHYPHYSNQGGSPGGAIRAGDLKLIERYEDGRLELYDLAADPGEVRDLSTERPGDARFLQARLATWRAEMDAKMLRERPEEG
jgi:arylsulfatase A-like enzyme